MGKERTSVYPKFLLSEPAAVPIISDKREFTYYCFVVKDDSIASIFE